MGLRSIGADNSAKPLRLSRRYSRCRARQAPRPDYELIDTSGEEHARVFHVRCHIPEPPLSGEGEGSSLRAAEQAAAAAVVAQLGAKA